MAERAVYLADEIILPLPVRQWVLSFPIPLDIRGQSNHSVFSTRRESMTLTGIPRRPRLDQPGLSQHVIQRGNNRNACFLSDEDFYCTLHWLKKAAVDHHGAIHACVLMTHHVHLLATPERPGALATMMQSFGGAMCATLSQRDLKTQRHIEA